MEVLMIKFTKQGSNYLVLKAERIVAAIKKISDGWVLVYHSGRREEYDTLAEAKDTALKI